jgi:salicylate hydroxylase
VVHGQRSLKVAVIGAGIGGLAAAGALQRRGMDVDVYETAPALGEVGAGLQLGPNAVKVLTALGFRDVLDKRAFEPTTRITLNWNDATVRNHDPIKQDYPAKFGAPYKTMYRPDLHRMLLDRLGEEHVHLGKTCIGAETRGDVAVAHFGDGDAIEADVIVGADGIRSKVREHLFGADAPRFTNSIAWRCLIDISHFPERVGPGGSVHLDRTDYVSWYGPNGQVICYPIGDGTRLNIFAGHATDTWVEESWSVPSSREELLAAYSGWNEALLGVFEHVEHCYKWGIFDRQPTREWTVGRVTLLGDAAHPTMPNLAQGANMAIEDAYVITRSLEAERSDPVSALKRYVAERQPRTSRITIQSRVNFENSMKTPPAPPLDRTWIFSFDATKDSVSPAISDGDLASAL